MIKNYLLGIVVFLTFSTSNTIAQTFNGFAIYGAQNSQSVYLIDSAGDIAKSWSCNTNGNYSVFLKDNGNLVRQGVATGASMRGAAYGGVLQEYDKDANIVWEFTYSSTSVQAHHDFAVLPNGNVLLTAWELKSGAEMSAAGFASSTEKWPTHLIEVQQDGTGGKIVWEWHMWDHMIQDKDNTKPNFGVVKDHPELMDINGAPTSSRPSRDGDWFHVNGVDYNADLDQIVFTSRTMSEFYIIDHSTTTAEAAGHTGGNAGKGGDFLFRYGNPANYGATGTQLITAACHDPRWIKAGRPNAGYIQFFNNSGGTGNSSVVDAINPVMAADGYNYVFTSGTYQPTMQEWRHECEASSTGQSASDRMSNGNVFVNVSRQYMYEADSNGNVIWQYSASTPKAFRYECDHPGIIALQGNTCTGSTSIDKIEKLAFQVAPNPSTGIININGLADISNYSVVIYNTMGRIIKSENNKSSFNISNYPAGSYMVLVSYANQQYTQKVMVLK